ncbi:PadR family transcriptional regulator [Levilactobacillus bambusae]|uniref:PadR family transcriptional regulator n=1 Tax=Levilactobacillus bambusae TaxID=2024736 RepID=A0A2V1MXJ4_9LACO|nr:PadR family transcriptional regulator [Levilactobacillus bambusae]PWF99728.1 PadR family transcriptional regulator [Levilactobacillus bambusae]
MAIVPKKRVLPYIILGILKLNSQMTGSEIDAEFQHEIGEFWQTTHSQIYPELKRMVADQWIGQETSSQDRKQKWYHLLPAGEHQLQNWLTEPLTPSTDDEFPLKVFFIQDQSSPILYQLLTQELQIHQAKLTHLTQRMTTLFDHQTCQTANFGHYLILQRAIERETNSLQWLETMLKQLDG